MILIHEIKNDDIFRIMIQFEEVKDYFDYGIDLMIRIENPNIKSDGFVTDSNGLYKLNRKS